METSATLTSGAGLGKQNIATIPPATAMPTTSMIIFGTMLFLFSLLLLLLFSFGSTIFTFVSVFNGSLSACSFIFFVYISLKVTV